MKNRTRLFFGVAVGVLVLGLGTGLLASYVGQNFTIIGGNGPDALAYVPAEQIRRERREQPTNLFQFGNQLVTTKTFMMVPLDVDRISLDVVDYMWEQEA